MYKIIEYLHQLPLGPSVAKPFCFRKNHIKKVKKEKKKREELGKED